MLKQRLFIGLSINNWISNIETIQHQLEAEYISWQKPESLHLTMVFIGEVDNKTTQKIYDIISGNITQNLYHSFMLRAEKLFVLNHRHIVLNVVSPELFELQKTLQDLLAQEHIIQPEYNFNAHITIGKIIKNPEQNNILLKSIQKIKTSIIKWQKLKISNIYLFESHPPKKYMPIHKFQLI